MYEYIFVEALPQRIFGNSNHKELIEEYAKEGWRFVSAIPSSNNGNGVIKSFDLVFEKEID